MAQQSTSADAQRDLGPFSSVEQCDAACASEWALLRARLSPDVAALLTEGEHQTFKIGFAAGCSIAINEIKQQFFAKVVR